MSREQNKEQILSEYGEIDLRFDHFAQNRFYFSGASHSGVRIEAGISNTPVSARDLTINLGELIPLKDLGADGIKVLSDDDTVLIEYWNYSDYPS